MAFVNVSKVTLEDRKEMIVSEVFADSMLVCASILHDGIIDKEDRKTSLNHLGMMECAISQIRVILEDDTIK